jgi:AcrR family transcriptional regulator
MANSLETGSTPPLPDSTEQRIFDAAHEIFVQKGLDGAKMQEIADRAGINKALLHYYYRTKEKLYETVARAVINRAVPVARQLFESDLPLREKIERFIDFYIDTIGRNPFVPLFIISELNKHSDRFIENILPKELPRPEVFLRQVEAAVAAGAIRPIAPVHLAVNIVSMCIFPFIGKPMLRLIFGLSPAEMKAFLDQRKTEVKRFVFAALDFKA